MNSSILQMFMNNPIKNKNPWWSNKMILQARCDPWAISLQPLIWSYPYASVSPFYILHLGLELQPEGPAGKGKLGVYTLPC